eukprot:CAMPEP_0116866780 /NCGR_PEP_ID=MMETSP0418-20121206/26240_1 /TAXON_ID=1158023 /ORGANISM="Astrosyne radiata, Strain 13vi08-1A" /LENGTH=369 /DNA_ID=CAMNT_0004502495 /DNA_START=64 /DNA_END=1173 /DNA_ORIENTATION=-
MNAQQITALSQIQAQAIVHARKTNGSPTQIQTQIQLQAQALVHAHTQAQIAAGIYKGDAPTATTKKEAQSQEQSGLLPTSSLTPTQLQQQQELTSRQNRETEAKNQAPIPEQQKKEELEALEQAHKLQLEELHASFRKQNDAAAEYADAQQQQQQQAKQPQQQAQLQPVANPTTNATEYAVKPAAAIVPNPTVAAAAPPTTIPPTIAAPAPAAPAAATITPTAAAVPPPPPSAETALLQVLGETGEETTPSATSPQFLAKLSSTLHTFWTEQLQLVQQLPPSTEQDFKTHNDLPLARIKRIMKSDEDVRMISAEAPVLFAKACELFILELTLRSWSFSQHHKRRTLQKEDIREAIQRTDIFDFLVDVIQ